MGVITTFTGVSLQLGFAEDVARGFVDFVVGGIQDVVPTAVQAVLVLVIGVGLAFFVGSKVYQLAVRFQVDERVRITAFDDLFDRRGDAIARGLSTFVKYLLIAFAILVAIGVLDIRELQNLNQQLLAYAPRLLAAALVAVLGIGLGQVAYRLATTFLQARGFGRSLGGTVLDRALTTDDGALANVGGRVVEYYVYLVTLFVVADVLQVGPLRELFEAASFYAPALVAGGAVLVVGVLAASVVADLVEGSETAQRTPVPAVVGEATKALVVLVTAVVALDVAGVSTQLLVTVLHVVVLPLALGVALAVGLAFGYGSRDLVEGNVEDWF